jgi:uncharacterized protein (DUF885 family)
MLRTLLRISLILAATACARGEAGSPAPAPGASSADTARALADDLWEARLKRFPLGATFVGDRRYDAQLEDLSPKAHEAWLALQRDLLERVDRILAENRQPEERLTARVLAVMLRAELAADVCRFDLWSVSQLGGPQVDIPQIGTYQIVDAPEAAAAYLSRLDAAPALFDQHIANLETGLAGDLRAPRIAVQRVIEQLDAMLARRIDDSPFLSVMPRVAGLDASARERFRAGIARRVEDGIRPALRHFRDFLGNVYLPKARREVGVGANRDGAACYAASIQMHVGGGLTPEAIHQIGLDELARLHAEMEGIAGAAGYDSVKSYVEMLEASPEQHLQTREQLLEHNVKIVRRAQAALPRAFGRLPPTSVGVRAIERFREKDAPAAYYYMGADDGTRPAYYYVNTYAPESRPLFNMEALAFHEAVPGHHLQISIAQSLQDLPEIRRHVDFTAFVEGWALYAELVAGELGLYSTEATRFGSLNYQAWRAARLVVDTGMHAKGWSRQQAITFMSDNLGFPENEVANEIDRYIIWPGQALGYMLGRMQIQKLRRRAEQRLGDRFDLGAFHDAVLGNGALPLEVLEEVIDSWLDEVG